MKATPTQHLLFWDPAALTYGTRENFTESSLQIIQTMRTKTLVVINPVQEWRNLPKEKDGWHFVADQDTVATHCNIIIRSIRCAYYARHMQTIYEFAFEHAARKCQQPPPDPNTQTIGTAVVSKVNNDVMADSLNKVKHLQTCDLNVKQLIHDDDDEVKGVILASKLAKFCSPVDIGDYFVSRPAGLHQPDCREFDAPAPHGKTKRVMPPRCQFGLVKEVKVTDVPHANPPSYFISCRVPSTWPTFNLEEKKLVSPDMWVNVSRDTLQFARHVASAFVNKDAEEIAAARSDNPFPKEPSTYVPTEKDALDPTAFLIAEPAARERLLTTKIANNGCGIVFTFDHDARTTSAPFSDEEIANMPTEEKEIELLGMQIWQKRQQDVHCPKRLDLGTYKKDFDLTCKEWKSLYPEAKPDASWTPISRAASHILRHRNDHNPDDGSFLAIELFKEILQQIEGRHRYPHDTVTEDT